MTNISPCNNMGNGKKWNWKTGELWEDTSISTSFNRNYFDCGIYYFDGEFNVVKFPAGMSLYHGSGLLADNVVEFPAGIKYYEKYKFDNPHENIEIDESNLLSVISTTNESIEEAITKYLPISAGWYSDPGTSQIYSGYTSNNHLNKICGNRCVNAYKLKKDIILFILDDDFNISKLLASNIPENIKEYIKKMFTLTSNKPERTNFDNPFQRFKYTKIRKSDRLWDLPFAEWFCGFVTTIKDYSGYAATSQQLFMKKESFHLEFIFCNAFKYLERDLTNILDWQYNNIEYPTDTIRTYMQQLSIYKCTNINVHSGNLLEHSIWSLLYAENLIKHDKLNIPFYINNNEIKKLAIFTSFIHDIGKMSPYDCTSNDGSFYYRTIDNHSQHGYDYILGTLDLPIIDRNMYISGSINIKELFSNFDIDYEKYKYLVSLVIFMHQEYGLGPLSKLNSNLDTIENLSSQFIQHIFTTYNTFISNKIFALTLIYVLLVVSISDIQATQPYGINRISKMVSQPFEINKRSDIYPFITNVPKKFRGGNLSTLSKIDTNGIILANTILSMSDLYIN